uniref:Uncharacterized protein n=1 Tax=viral metagenome TaxID=1070528 RepID=A0A2V0RCF2_9ZZZZ
MPQSKKSVTKSKPRQETERIENQQPMGGGQTKEPLNRQGEVTMEEKVKVKKSVKSMVKKAVTKVKNALNSEDRTTEQIPVEAVAGKEKSSMLDQMNFWSTKRQEEKAIPVFTEESNDQVPNKIFEKLHLQALNHNEKISKLEDHLYESTMSINQNVSNVTSHLVMLLDVKVKPDIIDEMTKLIKNEVVEQINGKLDTLIFQVITLLKNNDGTTNQEDEIAKEIANEERVELPTQDEDEALMWEAALHFASEQSKEERLRMLSNLTIGQSALQDVFMQIGDSMSEVSGDQVETIEGEATAVEQINSVSSIVSSIEKQSTPAEDAVRNCFGDMTYEYNNETSYLLIEDRKVFFKVNEDDLLLSFVCKSTPKKCVKDIGEVLVEFANGKECTGCSYQSSPESDDWELLKRVSGRLNDHIESVRR